MGEMHYSRYRKEWWEESLRKIKAGGVSVVSACDLDSPRGRGKMCLILKDAGISERL